MKISNFKLKEVIGNSFSTYKFLATVDVTTTTWFFWKNTETVEVAKSYAGHWFFVASGEWVLNDDVASLARAFEAKQGVELHDTVLTAKYE